MFMTLTKSSQQTQQLLTRKHQTALNKLLKLNKSRSTTATSTTKTLNDEESEEATPRATIPSATKVVICGGGLFGTSIAYHLGQLGYKDVVLLTRNVYAAKVLNIRSHLKVLKLNFNFCFK
jgi:shikimate 5-dehydrogenase